MNGKPKVYFSGPEHLLPNGKEVLEGMYALAAEYGFEALPLPEETFQPKSTFEEGQALAAKRRELIRQCDVLIANTKDFRNPIEPYGETSFELGCGYYWDKKLVCYMPDARNCADRWPFAKHKNEDDRWVDEKGISFEPGALNLMLNSPSRIVEGTVEDALKAAKAWIEEG